MPALFLIIFPEHSKVSSRKEEKKVRKREKGVRQEKEKKMEERRRKEEGGKGRKEGGKGGSEGKGRSEGRKRGRWQEEARILTFHSHSVQFSSVTQWCPTLCNIMDCSMPGFPVRHQLSQPTQTHACPLSR